MEQNKQYQIFLERARRYCSRQETCRFDMAHKLHQWKAEEGFIHPILEDLQDEQFIDDTRFALSYAKDKTRFNKWGKRKIAYMLQQKRILQEDILSALNALPEEEYEAMVMEELQRKRKSVKAVNRYDLMGKMQRFAYQRGYEQDYVQQILNKE